MTPAKSTTPAPYDRLIDALNRLPRPMMTIGTVLVFGFAMSDPEGFAARMKGLEQMPEALWWLLGGVISFYFGAREAHYYRQSHNGAGAAQVSATGSGAAVDDAAGAGGGLGASVNPALVEWQGLASRPN